MVPARPRRPLHLADGLWGAGPPARPGLPVRLGVQLRQPRRGPGGHGSPGWFAASGAPYAAEICRRTAADRKGGHLAIRKADRQLILRDTAQTAADEMDFFTDEFRHPYFHTNNLWFDLQGAVARRWPSERGARSADDQEREDRRPGGLLLPEVIQIEWAMGAAVEVFEGATAIGVGRERFLPVKTTNDLLLLRSDVYEVAEDGRWSGQPTPAPLIDLDSRYYKTIGTFEKRFPGGAPSLKRRPGWRSRVTGPSRLGCRWSATSRSRIPGSPGRSRPGQRLRPRG